MLGLNNCNGAMFLCVACLRFMITYSKVPKTSSTCATGMVPGDVGRATRR